MHAFVNTHMISDNNCCEFVYITHINRKHVLCGSMRRSSGPQPISTRNILRMILSIVAHCTVLLRESFPRIQDTSRVNERLNPFWRGTPLLNTHPTPHGGFLTRIRLCVCAPSNPHAFSWYLLVFSITFLCVFRSVRTHFKPIKREVPVFA